MWAMVIEQYSGFSLHRGIYEFAQYAQLKGGMLWKDLSDSENGITDVLIIMFVEWLVVLFVACGLDRDNSPGSKESTHHDQMDSADVNQAAKKGQDFQIHNDNKFVHDSFPNRFGELTGFYLSSSVMQKVRFLMCHNMHSLAKMLLSWRVAILHRLEFLKWFSELG
nr:abc transporter a family member 12 [Quercus suber]